MIGLLGAGQTYPEFMSAYNGVREDLYAYAAEEVEKAKTTPLKSINAEVVPAEMVASSTNVQGAKLKAAYWLAKAARLASTKGNNTGAQGLLAHAETFLKEGEPGIVSNVWYSVTKFSESTKDISDVFYKAATLTNSGGVKNVTEVLTTLSGTGAIQDQVDSDIHWYDYLTGGIVRKQYKGLVWTVGIVGTLAIFTVVGLAYFNRQKLGKAAAAALI